MKAIKRERYGAKEDERLIKMLTAAGEYPQNFSADEVKMEDDRTAIVPVPVDKPPARPRKVRGAGRKSRRDEKDDDEEDEVVEDEEMGGEEGEGQEEGGEMAVDKPAHVFSKRTMRDQFGNYPEWMNKRKMKTQQKKNKRIVKRRAMSLAGKRVVKKGR